MYMGLVLALLVAVGTASAQALPQFGEQSLSGTTPKGTSSSEQQLHSTTVRTIDAPDADAGVAVNSEHFYSIDNYSITTRPLANVFYSGVVVETALVWRS